MRYSTRRYTDDHIYLNDVGHSEFAQVVVRMNYQNHDDIELVTRARKLIAAADMYEKLKDIASRFSINSSIYKDVVELLDQINRIEIPQP